MSCKLLSQDICDAGRSSVELLSTSLSTGTILLVPVSLLSPLSSLIISILPTNHFKIEILLILTEHSEKKHSREMPVAIRCQL